MLNIVLFGPPGAGKGTQSEKIIERYQLVHISTGDLFRKHTNEGTELGRLARKYIDNGDLVPDDVVIRMVEVKINSETEAKGFIFDGFPRTVNQAKALDELMKKNKMVISGMVCLDVDEEELKTRILERAKTSGRVDDQDEEKINNRIRVYNDETLPVAAYYNGQDKYYEVQGIGSIDNIFNTITSVLDKLPQ
ncbi:adenylate kinase [Bacteroidota bacterium]